MKDQFDNEFAVGDEVVHPQTWGRTAIATIKTVREIKNGKLYLDNAKVPIQIPERLINLTKYFYEVHQRGGV